MITAEEYILANMQSTDLQEIESVVISFAKLHIKEALKIAAEKVIVYTVDEEGNDALIVDEDSILNCYDLDNVK